MEALVHPKPTTTAFWKIKEDAMKVELTFFKMPEDAKPEDFQVAIQGDVLVIRKPSDDQPQPDADPDGILFHVRLHVPELYDKANIKAELEPGNLVVTIPRLPKPDSVKELFYKKVTVEKEGTPTVEKEGTPKV